MHFNGWRLHQINRYLRIICKGYDDQVKYTSAGFFSYAFFRSSFD